MRVSRLHRSRQIVRGLWVVLFFFVMASMAHACLWDWDTLQMERRLFPGTLEIITGKFVRHSPAYYEWRIQDRTQHMRSPAEDPDLADDLAVAYSKLGRHAEAVALLEQVLEDHPDRYETLANLGTIHMLAGDLKAGKQFIDRAIVINPNAHFGREKYQSLLAEYFLTRSQARHPAAESFSVIRPKGEFYGFAKFVLDKARVYYDRSDRENSKATERVKAELAGAQKGVLGMMHFANYDSPLLLEALGDLLIAWPTNQDDALQLAARAYYRVAQVSTDKATQNDFKMAAVNILQGQMDYLHYEPTNANLDWPDTVIEKLSTELKRELAEAQAYVNLIAAAEQRWIDEKVDVDEAFAAKYYDSLESTIAAAQKQLATERPDVRTGPYQETINRALQFIGVIVAVIAITVCAVRVAYRRIRARPSV